MGAQLRVYRQKISSAQTTKKITRAMELISASRIQKALDLAKEAKPYEVAITKALAAVASETNNNHELLVERANIKKTAVIVLASDRGLAGAFNSNVLKETDRLAKLLETEGKEVEYYLFGKKAVNYFSFRRRDFVKSWIGTTDNPTVQNATEIRDLVIEQFIKGSDLSGVDEIYLVANKFVNMITQTPEVTRLLPLQVVKTDVVVENNALYEFEPDAQTVLDSLLPQYLVSKILSAMLQSAAAKHAATQKAMKSASDNADKLITTYTRLQNNARQAEITQQISEIIGGADALSTK